jgi:hypothetical protein
MRDEGPTVCSTGTKGGYPVANGVLHTDLGVILAYAGAGVVDSMSVPPQMYAGGVSSSSLGGTSIVDCRMIRIIKPKPIRPMIPVINKTRVLADIIYKDYK